MAQQQYVPTTPRGFIQKVALDYVQYGFRLYMTGPIPERFRDDPFALDDAVVSKWGVSVSRWTHYRRREQRQATFKYLRYADPYDPTLDFWALLATEGTVLRKWKGKSLDLAAAGDVRRFHDSPLRVWGHSISCYRDDQTRKWKPSVRIERREFLQLRAYFLTEIWRRDRRAIEREFRNLHYMRLGGVKHQYRQIIDALNKKRLSSGEGLSRIPYKCVTDLVYRRVRPFEFPRRSESQAA